MKSLVKEHVGSEANSVDRSLTESQDDQIVNFDNIKSRLRPRNPVNYNQVIVHSSPSTPGRQFRLLPENKRRRRASESQSEQKVNKAKRSRRKSGK